MFIFLILMICTGRVQQKKHIANVHGTFLVLYLCTKLDMSWPTKVEKSLKDCFHSKAASLTYWIVVCSREIIETLTTWSNQRIRIVSAITVR